jgi:hypothetical protein
MRMLPERIPFVWYQDKRDNTWKYGLENDGMGAFQEPNGKWYGNAVVPQMLDPTPVGPYDTLIEAMRECEIMYLRLKALPV